MKKIIGVVSIYYPDIDEIIKNIQTYLFQLDKLIIWDNTPNGDKNVMKIKELIESDKIELKGTGKNEGLGKPFNEAVCWAQQNDFDYLLTMDQDSCFNNQNFKEYLDFVENDNNENIAVYSPNRDIIPIQSKNFVEVRTAISSGAIYPVRLFEKIGLFREDFFLYMIDIEFCLRAKTNNLLTVCLPTIRLQHREGYAKMSNMGFSVNHYSAQSTYYIIRNSILTWKLYPEFTNKKDRYYFYKYKILYRFLKIIFEKQSLLKVKALILGLIHGYKFKSGKYELT